MKHQIMLVDDEFGTLKLTSAMLERGGYHVLTASSADEALTLLDSAIPDLCIIDLMMPGVPGDELCRMIRANPSTARLPVLILSGRSDTEAKERAARAGANGYLSKPVLYGDLVAKMRELIAIEQNPAPPNETQHYSPMQPPQSEGLSC